MEEETGCLCIDGIDLREKQEMMQEREGRTAESGSVSKRGHRRN